MKIDPTTQVIMLFQFPNGKEVTKRIDETQYLKDEDIKYLHQSFFRSCKEAWRDYLYNRYGEKWRDHDPSPPGSFWNS